MGSSLGTEEEAPQRGAACLEMSLGGALACVLGVVLQTPNRWGTALKPCSWTYASWRQAEWTGSWAL